MKVNGFPRDLKFYSWVEYTEIDQDSYDEVRYRGMISDSADLDDGRIRLSFHSLEMGTSDGWVDLPKGASKIFPPGEFGESSMGDPVFVAPSLVMNFHPPGNYVV